MDFPIMISSLRWQVYGTAENRTLKLFPLLARGLGPVNDVRSHIWWTRTMHGVV